MISALSISRIVLCLGFNNGSCAYKPWGKEVFHRKIDAEEASYALNPRQNEELKKIRLQHIKKTEDVDIIKDITYAKFDIIVQDLQRQYKLEDATAQTLRNTKESDARCKVCRMYSYDHGKVNIVYGIFAVAQIAPNRYDLIIAYYHNSFDAYRVDGEPITEGVLEKQQRLQALNYFRSETKALLC